MEEHSGIEAGMKPVLPTLKKRYSKKDIVKVIEDCSGLTTAICNKLDCSFTQFYRCVKDYGLDELLKQTRESLAYKAESTLAELLESDTEGIRLKAAEDILKFRGQNIGWNSQPQTVIQQAIISDNDKKIQIQNIFGIDDPK